MLTAGRFLHQIVTRGGAILGTVLVRRRDVKITLDGAINTTWAEGEDKTRYRQQGCSVQRTHFEKRRALTREGNQREELGVWWMEDVWNSFKSKGQSPSKTVSLKRGERICGGWLQEGIRPNTSVRRQKRAQFVRHEEKK